MAGAPYSRLFDRPTPQKALDRHASSHIPSLPPSPHQRPQMPPTKQTTEHSPAAPVASSVRSTSTSSAGSSSANDQLMSDFPRPPLSTSLSDFALPNLASSSSASMSSGIGLSLAYGSKDDSSIPALRRLRRPSTLVSYLSESRLHTSSSPLATVSVKGKERCVESSNDDSQSTDDGREGEAENLLRDSLRRFRDKDRTMDTSSLSSESDSVNTPPIRMGSQQMDEISERPKSSPMDMSRSASPAAATLRPSADILDGPSARFISRRMSCPPKPPRLMSLRAEANPEDLEVKHEAQVQRYLASHPDFPPIPGQSRNTRIPSDRGRYPEEAGVDEDVFQREDTPSDDEYEPTEPPPSFYDYKISTSTEPVSFTKPSTPALSMVGTPEDLPLGITDSPSVMDVDVPMSCSPNIPPYQWRQTPPPTAAPIRTNKRKHEDRYEPYAPVKRRAVSPSVAQLRDSGNLISPLVIPRSPILRSRGSFSQSQANSTASSPILSQSSNYIYNGNNAFSNGSGNGYMGHHRTSSSSSAVSSPTVRASMVLASPVLRPVPWLAKRSADEGEKMMDGAGEGLNGLSLGGR